MTDEEKRYINNLKQVLERAKNYSSLSAIEKLEEENKKLKEKIRNLNSNLPAWQKIDLSDLEEK